MLPIYRPARRTRMGFSDVERARKRAFLGRPLCRWLGVVCCASILALLLFSPSLSPYIRQHASRKPSVILWTETDNAACNARPLHLRPHHIASPSTVWSKRADSVRNAFLHAYTGYQRYAGATDELLPVTNGSVNNFNGWRVSLIDALDTMWIMGLYDEFDAAIPVVANETFDLDDGSYAPFFETVIRYLGGLLSAYALSGENVFLSRADDLGKMLLPALDTPSGMPMYAVNTRTGNTRGGWSKDTVLWSEALSCQMEYKYLAHLTGRTHYYEKVDHLMNIVYDANITDGRYPTMWDIHHAKPKTTQFSVGAYADSAHEYLLKQWILTAKSEPKALEMYLSAASAIINTLLYLSPTRHLLYVTDTRLDVPSRTFEHLSCFLPGLFALGAHTLDLDERTKELHSWAAIGLAQTCWVTYAESKTGLGPDEMVFNSWPPLTPDFTYAGRWMGHLERWEEDGRPGGIPPGLQDADLIADSEKRDYIPIKGKAGYLLRPETIESFYVLWRTSGDPIWRERGWAVFEAIERETRTDSGYASIYNVDEVGGEKRDEMPSYFLAETLKYLFLLFTDENLIPFEQWVFNTEGHPIPIFNWAEWEKEAYGI